MKCKKGEIVIPEWISCRTYLYGTKDSRTYISDERKHNCVLLEGLSSDMWQMLLDGTDEAEFAAWAERNGVTEQTEPFISELSESGLIRCENGEPSGGAAYGSFGDGALTDGEAKFVEEMQLWLHAHGFMYSLFIELTYRCNLKCVHCYNPKNMPSVELDFDKCKKAIDDAYELGCFRVVFSGGESTMHSRFIELVRYARSKRMSVEVFTNGQRLSENEELYGELLGAYPYRVSVSLYGMSPEVHERVTAVKGSFEKTYSLLRRLRRDNVNVQIKDFLLNVNCRDCIAVKNAAKAMGAASVADISLIPTIEGDKKTFGYMLGDDDLFRLYTDPESPLYVGTDFKPSDREKRKSDTPCLGGFTGLCITPNGNVTVCVSLPLSVGDINETSLKDIWQAAAAEDPESKLCEWRKVRISDFNECYNEDHCAFCTFCLGMGYLENGYLKKSDVLCKQAKIKMKAYRYLQERSAKCD